MNDQQKTDCQVRAGQNPIARWPNAHRLIWVMAILWIPAWPSLPCLAADDAAAGAAPAGPPPMQVRVDAVRSEEVQNRRFVTGELRPVRRSQVAAQEAGLVVELLVAEGQVVKTGEVLTRLDSVRLSIEIDGTNADEQVLLATLKQYDAELALNQWQLSAFEKLDRAGSSYENELRQALANVAVTQAKMVQAQRQIAVIDARRALLQKRLDDTTITAPYDAAVVARHAQLGEWLDVGEPVVELVSVGAIEAWFDIPESLAKPLARPHLTVEIQINALAQSHQVASLRIINQVNPRTRTFTLVAPLDDQQGLLKPGMSVTAWVPTGSMRRALTVSKDAILRNEAGSFAYLAKPGDAGPIATAVAVPIQRLFDWKDRVVIRSSHLAGGDLLVVEGNERVMPGLPLALPGDHSGPSPDASTKAGQ